ncbi:MAG TPA: hypothetical protein VJ739_15630 [Gemmataceae bacterium]|nr:hypothetical protein [Gemmataceae bacterium]
MGRRVLLLPMLAVLLGGCSTFWAYGVRNVVEEPVDCADNTIDVTRYYCLAKQAWDGVRKSCPGASYSADYGHGFERGYAHYLAYGELIRCPVAPPWCYRQPCDETPGGQRAIEDWFAGYRQGVEAARASGIHGFVLLPSNGATLYQYPYVPIEPRGGPGAGIPGGPPAAHGPDGEELPRPRPLAAPPPSLPPAPP